jgi:hypothetical protein
MQEEVPHHLQGCLRNPCQDLLHLNLMIHLCCLRCSCWGCHQRHHRCCHCLYGAAGPPPALAQLSCQLLLLLRLQPPLLSQAAAAAAAAAGRLHQHH